MCLVAVQHRSQRKMFVYSAHCKLTFNKLTNSQTYKLSNLQTHKLTNLQTYKLTNSQTYKLTNSQTFLRYIYKLTNLQTFKLSLGTFTNFYFTNLQTYKVCGCLILRHSKTCGVFSGPYLVCVLWGLLS